MEMTMDRNADKVRLSDIENRVTRIGGSDAGPVLDAGDVHAYLANAGILIGENGVTTHADGSVTIDADDSKELRAAWSAYVPPAPPVPDPAIAGQLMERIEAVKNIEDVKALLTEWLVPAVAPSEFVSERTR